MNHTSMITIVIQHSEPNILEGETIQTIEASHGITGKPLKPLELWQSWAVFARQLRDMLSPDGAAFTVCDGVMTALSMLGLHSHEEDLPKSIEGSLDIGDVFAVDGDVDERFRVTGVHEESGDLMIRREL